MRVAQCCSIFIFLHIPRVPITNNLKFVVRQGFGEDKNSNCFYGQVYPGAP
jgi:hypothetical protein